MARIQPIAQADLDWLRGSCEELSATFGPFGQRLQHDFMRPLVDIATTMQAVANVSRALAEIQAGLAIRLALREQETELRAKLTKEATT